ncbi:MAG: N-acetyl-alpha-D-glucosaminyl L-malate synthase BshA [Candidatus Doudnabacteria bacterium]|nr:N-acetyl-alpha-D-glucosaminyl L-malate synthase BshA [Candidatus Doudnabacteria bacterium]
MNKKLNIGIVCYPSVGGSGIVATNLGNSLAELGHSVHFIAYEKPFRLNEKQKNVHFHKVYINKYELFKYPDYTLPLSVAIGSIHKKYKLDILHVHYAVPHATAALLAEQMLTHSGIKPPHLVTTLHGTDITLLAKNKHLYEIIKYSIENSCCVTAVSDYLAQQTKKILQTTKPIKVIHNFYSPKEVTKSKEKVRKSLNLKPTDFVALHMSNLREVKRIPDLLKIVSNFKSQENFKLLILSGGSFQQYKPLVKKLGIEEKVVLVENAQDIENYINAADFGLYTSGEESFGLSILETMSLGKPVVASRAGGVPEVITDKQNGFLCKVGDIKSFVSKIKLLEKDQDLLTSLGENARQTAEQEFSSKKIINEYLNYYRHI